MIVESFFHSDGINDVEVYDDDEYDNVLVVEDQSQLTHCVAPPVRTSQDPSCV